MLVRNPLALEAFGYDCFHYYYLHQHVQFVRRETMNYLSAPANGDVLDARVSDGVPLGVGAVVQGSGALGMVG